MTPATNWQEQIPEGEAAQHERFAEQIRDMQRKNAKGRPPLRALHAKGQAGLEAEFTVLDGLPDYARAGVFAKPGTYRAWVRFSNGEGRRHSDAKPDVRGVAVKVVGVPGRKLIPGLEDAKTQDFLMIRKPSQPFRSADEFVWLLGAMSNPALLVPRLLGRFGPRRGFGILRELVQGLSLKTVSFATSRYFSALPIRFGACAVHYALEPVAVAEPGAKPGKGPDHLAAELASRLAAGPVVYDFRVQFFRDEATTPIEDASKEWREQDAPFVTVARLTLAPQSPESPRGRRVAEFVEKLSFDPWHATEDLRPLGNMMRARNAAYRLSTQERGAAPEPDGTESFDDVPATKMA